MFLRSAIKKDCCILGCLPLLMTALYTLKKDLSTLQTLPCRLSADCEGTADRLDLKSLNPGQNEDVWRGVIGVFQNASPSDLQPVQVLLK